MDRTHILFERNSCECFDCVDFIREAMIRLQRPTRGYAMHRSRSHDAVIRVYDESGNVVATHERKGEILERISKLGISRWDHPAGAVRLSSPISLQLFAAVRSSIRSRSTSQYLSDDRRSLSISSASADSS